MHVIGLFSIILLVPSNILTQPAPLYTSNKESSSTNSNFTHLTNWYKIKCLHCPGENCYRPAGYSRPVICVRSEESLLRKLCSCEAKNTHQPSVPVPLNCSFSNKDHNNYNNDNNNLSRFLYATFFSAGLVIGLLAAFLFYKKHSPSNNEKKNIGAKTRQKPLIRNTIPSKNSERMRVIELKTINEQKLDAIEKKVKKQMLSTIEEEEETSL